MFSPLSRRARLAGLAGSLLLPLAACGSSERAGGARDAEDTLVVYLAASLTRPMQPLLDTIAARAGVVVQRESGGSLEHARRITELHRIPDVVALADEEIFPRLLVPEHATWYASFARDRMVIAYTPRSGHASAIDSANWRRVLSAPDVQVGRTDPALAPAGYRTLLTLKLAERYYTEPGLARRLLDNAPARNVRPNAAELAALLAAGELDYIYEYRSVAVGHGFEYLALPAAIDLGDPRRAASYGEVSVAVRGRQGGDSLRVAGAPILLALSVPADAPHPAAAERFAALVLSPEGRRMLRAGRVDVLETPILHGDDVPSAVRTAVGDAPSPR